MKLADFVSLQLLLGPFGTIPNKGGLEYDFKLGVTPPQPSINPVPVDLR